eukprot:2395636-Pyramimonas_sp.AAC.1
MHLMNPKKKLLLARFEEETRASSGPSETAERGSEEGAAADPEEAGGGAPALSDAELARQLQYELNWGTRRPRTTGRVARFGGGGGA